MSTEHDRINTDDGRGERARGLERLPRRRSPERDLWPGIQSRLRPRRLPVRGYPLMQFALAASLVAGLAAVMTLGLRDAGLGPTGAGAASTLALTDDSRAIVEANLAMVRHAERQLQQALQQDPESTSLRSLLQSAEYRQRALRAML
jgi:hypothetical protein